MSDELRDAAYWALRKRFVDGFVYGLAVGLALAGFVVGVVGWLGG